MLTDSNKRDLSPHLTLICSVLIAYAAAVLLRLWDLVEYGASTYRLDDGWLMTTHDAYGWLAGAVGVGPLQDEAFTTCLRAVLKLGFEPSTLGFWAPAIVAPLVALPLCLTCARLKLPEAGLTAGILAAAGMGFLSRSRLGNFDTDLLTLLFPVVMTCLFALCIEPMARKTWLNGWTPHTRLEMKHRRACLGILAAGLIGKIYQLLHPAGQPVMVVLFGLSILVLLLSIRPTFWSIGCVAMGGSALIAMVPLPPVAVVALLMGLAVAILFLPSVFWTHRLLPFFLAFLLVVAMLLPSVQAPLLQKAEQILSKTARYGKTIATFKSGSLHIPNPATLIGELRTYGLATTLKAMSGWAVIAPVGLLGFLWLIWKKPPSLFFAPFIVLGGLSFLTGQRFIMYGSVVMGLGLGAAGSFVGRRYLPRAWMRFMVQIVLAAILFFPSVDYLRHVPLKPAISKEFATSLKDLRGSVPTDAILWTWWDHGYAAQFYARRATFAHGSKTNAQDMLTQGTILSAQNPLFVRNVILQSAEHGTLIDALPDDDQDLFHESLQRWGEERLNISGPLPPQYLVLSWDYFNIAPTIMYLGQWNYFSGTSEPAFCSPSTVPISLDTTTGRMRTPKGTQPLHGLYYVDKEKQVRKFVWNNPGSVALVIRPGAPYFLMEPAVFKSIMVSMLLNQPEQYSTDFELVLDRTPWSRVYRVRKGPNTSRKAAGALEGKG